jgi:hypothetical protein
VSLQFAIWRIAGSLRVQLLRKQTIPQKGRPMSNTGLYATSTSSDAFFDFLEDAGISPTQFMNAAVTMPAFGKELIGAYNRAHPETMYGIPNELKNIEKFVSFITGFRFRDLEKEQKWYEKHYPEGIEEDMQRFATENAQFEEYVEFFADRNNFLRVFAGLDELSISIIVAHLGLETGEVLSTNEIVTRHRITSSRYFGFRDKAWRLMRANAEALLDYDGEPVEITELSVQSLGLSTRTFKCLDRHSVWTVGELVQLTEDDLLNFTNFGPKSLREVKVKLDERGLRLKQ